MLRSSFCLLVFTVLCLPNCLAQDSDQEPNLVGYITQVSSPTSLEANGVHVVFAKTTVVNVESSKDRLTSIQIDTLSNDDANAPFWGEAIKIWGKRDFKHNSITARTIQLTPSLEGEVDGSAIIDSIPKSAALQPGEVLVRADGYQLLLTPSTQFKSTSFTSYTQAAKTNVWLIYHGQRRPDGIIVLDKASAVENAVLAKEDKLLTKTNYHPDKVDPESHQTAASKAFLGVNPKKIPPYQDAAMQARIDRIGNSLVPAYQKALPESDETKIDFRFQLIDEKKWHDALTMPSGVILVPYQVVEQLPDDSQLATILADNIACALEKQTFRAIPATQKMTAVNLGGAVAGAFVPGLGIATTITTSSAAAVIARHNAEQSARVSLTLLSDAGFDIRQTPLAWWQFSKKKSSNLPPKVAYLYRTIGTTWNKKIPSTASE
jgi:hypothetical protein